jgi:hypothetical protein
MKIIGIEEHYGLPFIRDAAFKANDPYGLVLETMRKSGQFPRKPKDWAPSGHLRSGRGADLCDGRRRHRRPDPCVRDTKRNLVPGP